jgi:hypothetical protein
MNMAKTAKTAKKSKTKTASKPKKNAKPMTKKTATSAKRLSWVDARTQTPLIDKHARQLGSFMKAMQDGRVDESEIKDQEGRIVKLMKEIEPLLDDRQHRKITELLCELTAYDIMQMLYTINESRPKTAFRG